MNKETLWKNITELAETNKTIQEIFEQEPNRIDSFTSSACGLHIDFSKQRISQKAFDTMVELAQECDLQTKIDKLLSGAVVNPTENRPALHTALRYPKNKQLLLNNENIIDDVHDSLNKVEQVADKIRDKKWQGFSGKTITDVVNIGVGGSDLGPVMTNFALQEYNTSDINVHFSSSIDGSQLAQLLPSLSPETTIFIIASKTFSTIDTLSNANTALMWLTQSSACEEVAKNHHFIGVSTNTDKMTEWGIKPDNQLIFWDWVGGRFSMWSAIGLAIVIKLGMAKFHEILAGAHAMDQHFQQTNLSDNLPVILGLLGVWNSSFLDIQAHSVLPYDGRLKYFPNYLTQLEMESNGKSVTLNGETVNHATCPVLWGEIGSNAQHAFYQLLHQGTHNISCDFIAPLTRYTGNQDIDNSLEKQLKLAFANCLAQSRVLAFGNHAVTNEKEQPENDNKLHKQYRGNQPSSTILLDEITPYSLGALIALYEHKVFVMSVLWDINPFDQWGVEIGKVMANLLSHAVDNSDNNDVAKQFDASTHYLLRKMHTKK